MPKRVRTGLTRTDILHRYLERFKQQLIKLRPFLSRKRSTTTIEDFDESAEELISQVFGLAHPSTQVTVSMVGCSAGLKSATKVPAMPL